MFRANRAAARHHLPEVGGSRLSQLQQVNALIASFAPVGWWSMRATSGTNEPDRGSAGSAADMTILTATLAQTGQLGANEAALMDGAASRYQTPNLAAIANLTTWEWVFLVKPSSAGEGSLGAFIYWANGGSGDNYIAYQGVGAHRIQVWNSTPTAFITDTTTALSNGIWQLLFVAFDNAGDRKVHVYKGVSGVVSEFAYSAQPAMTGTYKAQLSALNLFNSSNQAVTFAGLTDEAFVVSGNLTAAQRTALTVACGV